MSKFVKTDSVNARSIWVRRLDSSARPSLPGHWKDFRLTALGHAAAHETLVTATPHMASIWTDLFQSILARGPQLRWRENGPGIGRDAKTAYSSLLGRYMARAYLTEFEGVRVLVPLDVAKFRLKGTRFEIKKDPPSNGLEADWIGLDSSGLVIAEAKGSHNNAVAAWRGPKAIPATLESAIEQVKRTVVLRRSPNRKLPSRRWAIASRWGTEQNTRDPTLIAWDPNVGDLDEGDYRSLEKILLEADLHAVASGMGFSVEVSAPSMPTPIVDAAVRRLRIGGRPVEPGLVAAIGAFGVLPVRTRGDLPRIRQAREVSSSIALASLSAQYIQSVREGGSHDGETQYTEYRGESRSGLNIIWPSESDEIDIDD